MIPAPGESPAEWAANAGQREAVAEYAAAIGVSADFDPVATMFHDVPEPLRAQVWAEGEPAQSPAIFTQPFPLSRWPVTPTRVIAGVHDRMFPFSLQQRLARERLSVDVEPIETGHLSAFARPDLVVELLTR